MTSLLFCWMVWMKVRFSNKFKFKVSKMKCKTINQMMKIKSRKQKLKLVVIYLVYKVMKNLNIKIIATGRSEEIDFKIIQKEFLTKNIS